MGNFVNPIDLSIAFFILVIGILGIRNGFIIEIKKIINLSISLFLSHMAMQYVIKIYPQSNMINFLLYILFFISLILLIGFAIDLIIQHSRLVTIEKNVNKITGCLLAVLKSFILIGTILFFIKLLPIQENIKNDFFLKSSDGSTLFKICNELQSFILN
tara:strand:+ start:1172 stop:1648 length:477 start_codon:yes stop_codon:yes gene_type:complete